MRQESRLGSWILMITLIIAAMIFIFFILMARARNLASLEPTPTAEPSGMVILYEAPDPPYRIVFPVKDSNDAA